tara:strand:- start:398 stop:706 length:309 start_codon:yes stop_codon:yes gene_type:complete
MQNTNDNAKNGDPMKVPMQYELTHLQMQAMLRDNDIPESELKYLGDKEYPANFQAHPEYHGVVMPWYLVGGEHEVPVCDIASVDQVDDDDCVPENDGWGLQK